MASNNEKLKVEVLNMIENPLQSRGCEVAELSIAQHKKNTTVRVFVYCDGGVTLDKCRSLSVVIGDILDGTELFGNGYSLEVSSPGLDRPLHRAIDFKFRIGEVVKVQFAEAQRPTAKAKIISANETEIVFENEAGAFTEPLANIENAKIVY